MKTRQIFIITVLLLHRGLLPAATNGFSPELLSYHLQTTVESYDKAGRKSPKWDAEAKACLKTFAEIRASTNGVPSKLLGQLRTNLLHVVSKLRRPDDSLFGGGKHHE